MDVMWMRMMQLLHCSNCEWNKNRQITATSGVNKKKSQKKMEEMIHTSAVTSSL